MVQQLVGYLRYTGRDAIVVAKAALDPYKTSTVHRSMRDTIDLGGCATSNPGVYAIMSGTAIRSPVGKREHRSRNVEAEYLSSLEVDDELELGDCMTGRSAGFAP